MSLKNSVDEASKASGADFIGRVIGDKPYKVRVVMQLQQKLSWQQRLESVKRKLIK